jgi:hypothetical protein
MIGDVIDRRMIGEQDHDGWRGRLRRDRLQK